MRAAWLVLLVVAACGGDGGTFVVHAPAGDLRVSPIAASGGAVALGVPYATATGDAAAVRSAPFASMFDASSFGTACPGTVTARATGDDCLRLSLWSPDVAPTTLVPVLVFVPAGGVDLAAPLFDGVAYTRVGGVLVTAQHRAPADGVAATDSAGIARTDAALHDVALAVAWARENAAAFGGDASQLLVFGAGSGAGLVCAASAAGLLGDARIALESGTCLDVPAGRFPSLSRAPAEVFADAATVLPPLVTGYDEGEGGSAACDARRLAAAWDARGAGAWVYEMSYGATRGRGSELPYVFGNSAPTQPLATTDAALVYDVMSTWVDFARDGDPAGPAGTWPRWSATSPMHATFAVGLPAAADATCP